MGETRISTVTLFSTVIRGALGQDSAGLRFAGFLVTSRLKIQVSIPLRGTERICNVLRTYATHIRPPGVGVRERHIKHHPLPSSPPPLFCGVVLLLPRSKGTPEPLFNT